MMKNDKDKWGIIAVGIGLGVLIVIYKNLRKYEKVAYRL